MNTIACNCKYSDAWKCANGRQDTQFVACQCACHRKEQLAVLDESIRHLYDADKVNTDDIDPVVSAAFNLKLCHLSHLDSLIAQRTMTLAEYDALRRMHDALAKFLRENYTVEISAGRHESKPMEAVIVHYLMVERRHSRSLAAKIRRALRGAY